MAFNGLMIDRGDEIALIQNRLNVAGLSLTALFFSGSFSIALHALNNRDRDYRLEFAQVEAPLVLGATFGIAAICCLLLCQQLSKPSNHWFTSSRWWFAMANILIFMTLSQALSAGLSEMVSGISVFHPLVSMTLAVLATPVWWLLLFAGPMHMLHRAREVYTGYEWRMLWLVYLTVVILTLGLNAEVYLVRGAEQFSIPRFLFNFLLQLVQPLTWPEPWQPMLELT